MSGKRKASTQQAVKLEEQDETATVAVKTEEESDEAAMALQVDPVEYIGARRDRCSLNLVDAVLNWAQMSHHIGVGEVVRITDPKHHFHTGTGYIKKVNEDGTYDVHLEESESETFLEKVQRAQISGCLCKRAKSKLDAATEYKYEAFREVRKAMDIEDDRIKRCAEHVSYSNLQLDKNGKKLYMGDLVHIEDEDHEYNKWIGRIESLGPGKWAIVALGMPPAEEREDDEKDEELRSNRPSEMRKQVLADKVRLVGANIP